MAKIKILNKPKITYEKETERLGKFKVEINPLNKTERKLKLYKTRENEIVKIKGKMKLLKSKAKLVIYHMKHVWILVMLILMMTLG